MNLLMEKLLIAIASGLVEDKSAVKVDRDEPNDEGVVVYHLHVAPDDMGRVIGKQGKIAKAIRTVMRAGAGRINEKIMVEID
jgi:RNA-binding protein (KH domain)